MHHNKDRWRGDCSVPANLIDGEVRLAKETSVRDEDLVANEGGNRQLVEHLLNAPEHPIVILEQHLLLQFITHAHHHHQPPERVSADTHGNHHARQCVEQPPITYLERISLVHPTTLVIAAVDVQRSLLRQLHLALGGWVARERGGRVKKGVACNGGAHRVP
jgi:hypothetical protein